LIRRWPIGLVQGGGTRTRLRAGSDGGHLETLSGLHPGGARRRWDVDADPRRRAAAALLPQERGAGALLGGDPAALRRAPDRARRRCGRAARARNTGQAAGRGFVRLRRRRSMWSHGSRTSMDSKTFRSGRDWYASERRPGAGSIRPGLRHPIEYSRTSFLNLAPRRHPRGPVRCCETQPRSDRAQEQFTAKLAEVARRKEAPPARRRRSPVSRRLQHCPSPL
jgi:hypothetical protein